MVQRLLLTLLPSLLVPGSALGLVDTPPCLDTAYALKALARTGIQVLDLDREFGLEQLLVHAQLLDVAPEDRIGAHVDIYCVYDIKQSGFRIENGRVTEWVWSSHPTPMYFICDSSCDRTFTISDTDAGLRDLNRLLSFLSESVPSSEQARELASLAVILLKRGQPEPKRIWVKEAIGAFIVTLRYGDKRTVISINRQDSSVVWLK